MRRHTILIPDHETAVDFLNYEAIAGTAIELLNDTRERALSIGVHGDWGAKLGGRFADQSFASSVPAEEQIHLEETWVLNDDGTFARPKQQSAGLLVMGRDIAYLELMSYYGADKDEQQQDEPSDPDQEGLSA